MKKIFASLLSIIMLFSIPTAAFAAENQEISTYLPIAENTSFVINTNNNDSQPLAPNGIPITVTAKLDGTGVSVHVGNIGVDALDNVTVTATATGYARAKTQSGSVPALIGKTFDFYFPYIKCNTFYNITVGVVDGSGIVNRTGTAKLIYSEDNLKNAHWHPGGKGSRAASLEYHFDKHGNEVRATNLIEYLNYANIYRDDVLYDLNRGDTSDYTITISTNPTPGKKYKSKSTGQFIILANSDKFILSYGI